MRSVIMDRWGLDSAFQHLGGDHYEEALNHHMSYLYLMYKEAYLKRCADQCWENFLTAIVLWDEIWSVNHGPFDWDYLFGGKVSAASQHMDKIMRELTPFELDKKLLNDYYLLDDHGSSDPNFWEIEYDTINDLYVNPSLQARTAKYQAISRCLGIPYLAHPLRADNIIHSDTQKDFSRKDVLNKVDTELAEYYKYINAELGRDLYQFQYPVLIDLIKQGTSTPEEELLEALELREQPDVANFRKAMDPIERAVQSGKKQDLLQELQFVSDLARKITTKYQKKGALIGEFSLSVPRSASISIPFQLWRRPGKKYRPQVTFIRRLVKYGVDERT